MCVYPYTTLYNRKKRENSFLIFPFLLLSKVHKLKHTQNYTTFAPQYSFIFDYLFQSPQKIIFEHNLGYCYFIYYCRIYTYTHSIANVSNEVPYTQYIKGKSKWWNLPLSLGSEGRRFIAIPVFPNVKRIPSLYAIIQFLCIYSGKDYIIRTHRKINTYYVYTKNFLN